MQSVIPDKVSPNEESAPLYQRLILEDFPNLPDALRVFHSSPTGATAVGVATVERGGTWLKNRIADWMGFPPVGDQIPLTLRVEVRGDREFWIRDFDGFQLQTEQWLERGLLIEAAGPVRLSFEVSAYPGGFHFKSREQRIFGILVPGFLALKISAQVVGQPGGWVFEVEVRAPLLGQMVHYRGEVKPG